VATTSSNFQPTFLQCHARILRLSCILLRRYFQGSAGNGHSKADAATTTSQQGRHDAAAEASGDRSVYQEAAATPRQRQRQTTTYPDIAGMDYSPATRRSPIHN
jgi:hypothetical protein